ncbi:MAG: thermonuclease family protein [Planctomycetota bacterium]|nr:thermonuclease family protein [Planctomycetota bacterium]
MKSKRASNRRMNSTPNLQPVGIDKKQVTWVAITMIGVLLIALILPLAFIIQDSGDVEVKSKKSLKIAQKEPVKDAKTGDEPIGKVETLKVKRPNFKAPKTPSLPGDSNDTFGLSFDPVGETETVEVKKVIDGDTLLLGDGRKLRLLGIQAPGGSSVEAKSATAQLKRRVEGKSVTLSFDEKKSDRYKRVLAYVFYDGVFINGWMVGNGYGYHSEWKPNTRHTELLVTLQGTARAKKRGFWALEKDVEDHYLSYQRSRYFHRPKCKRVAKAKSTPDKLRNRDEAFEKSLIPCNDCNP